MKNWISLIAVSVFLLSLPQALLACDAHKKSEANQNQAAETQSSEQA